MAEHPSHSGGRVLRHVRGNLVAYIALFFALSSGSSAPSR